MLAEFMPYASSADFSNLYIFISFPFLYYVIILFCFLLVIILRLIFEKYDGIRAIWNSDERTMFSRWGKPISISPSFLLDVLPPTWLDGEVILVY